MQTQITCPRCQTPYTAEVHQIIDVGQNPELKQRLLSGQLNMAVCPNCGAGGAVSTPMLYHDPEHELFMILVPPELNLDRMEQEQLIGQLTRQVMEATPQEQRRAYMFQPQTILTMQTFMEKVLETEGVTREDIARQRKQSELLQTLVKADKDVVEHLIQKREDEIDETFFAILQNYIDTASQLNDNKQLLPLVNLRAKLMTETRVGRELEKRQTAVHRLSQEAKAEEGLTPALLLKHILANQEDEKTVDALVMAGQSALDYQFFQLLTEEIDKREEAGETTVVERLSEIRQHLLDIQAAIQKQSQQMMEEANKTLQAILSSPDPRAAIRDNMQKIDDTFMYFLSVMIAQADQRGQQEEAQALNQVYALIMREMERQSPPEIQLLNRLIYAESDKQRQQVLENNQHLVSPDLLKIVETVIERTTAEGQDELANSLRNVKGMIEARL